MKNRNFLMLMLSLICFAFMPQMSAQREYKQEKYVYGQKAEGRIQVMDARGKLVYRDLPSELVITDSVEQGQLMLFDTTDGWQAASRSEVLGYQEYVVLLTQTGTDAPTATVLYNDLSAPIVWTYVGAGSYLGTLASAFTIDKTAISPQFSSPELAAADGDRVRILRASANTITIETSTGGVATDAILSEFLVTVRVYN